MPLAFLFRLEQPKVNLFDRYHLFGRGVRAFLKKFIKREGSTLANW